MYRWKINEQLLKTLQKLKKKDRRRHDAVRKKIKEIVTGGDPHHYKNLRYNLKIYKRVKIDSSFVLVFRVDENQKMIIFEDLTHHKNAYSR